MEEKILLYMDEIQAGDDVLKILKNKKKKKESMI